MIGPPEQKRAPAKSAFRNPQLLAAGYRVLGFLQAPFGFVFWLIEQRKVRLQDRMENERNCR
jgi:hypothetical protein